MLIYMFIYSISQKNKWVIYMFQVSIQYTYLLSLKKQNKAIAVSDFFRCFGPEAKRQIYSSLAP